MLGSNAVSGLAKATVCLECGKPIACQGLHVLQDGPNGVSSYTGFSIHETCVLTKSIHKASAVGKTAIAYNLMIQQGV
jgi:hypothetical protein